MAKETDTPGILEIYSHYVKETPVTFEYEVPTLSEMEGRIRDIRQEFPYLVCLLEGRLVGFAYAHKQRERAAYQWNAELSVYLDRDFTERGIGTALYWALLELLALQNIQNVYAGIARPNPGSECLHKRLGFALAGTYHKTGFKCGRWHDVMWFEKNLGNHPKDPSTFIKIEQVSKEMVDEILKQSCSFIKK